MSTITVDPSFTPPPPPTTSVSTDGILTATADPAKAGVGLKADYTSLATQESNDFTTDISGWTAYQYGGPTATVTWDSVGEPNLKASWTGGGSGSAGAQWALATAWGAGVRVRFTFQIGGVTANDGQSLRIAFAPPTGSSWKFFTLPDPQGSQDRVWSVEATVPAGSLLGRVFVYLSNPAASGQFFLDNVKVERVMPEAVRFERTDGSKVRSGNTAPVGGGIAYAYDYECSLGDASAWVAVPVFSDGSEGDPSQPAALTVPRPDDASDAWLKSIVNPDASVKVRMALADEDGRALRSMIEYVTGDEFPVANWDLPTSLAIRVTIRTNSQAEYNALVALVKSGPMLLQGGSATGIPEDMYVLPVGQLRSDRLAETGFDWRLRHWTLQLQAIAKPDTTGAPLRIPGNTCDGLLAGYATCDILLAQVPTCADLIEV